MSTSSPHIKPSVPSVIYDPEKVTLAELKNWATNKDEPPLVPGRMGWITVVGSIIVITLIIIAIISYSNSSKTRSTDYDSDEESVRRSRKRKQRNRDRDDRPAVAQPQSFATLPPQVNQ